MPAGAGEIALGAACRVSRLRRTLWADGRVLRAPRRVALVRPQRGWRLALPLSRLEIRRDRPMHRGAVGAGRGRLLQKDQARGLSAGQARRRAVDLYGSAGAKTAVAGMGICPGASGTNIRLQTPAGMQLAASHGRRHRLQPRLVLASWRSGLGSAVQGRQRQSIQFIGHAATFRSGRAAGRTVHRRAAQCREREILLAHHAVGDAMFHHDPAARRSSDPRPLLGADRRRELLGLVVRLPPGTGTDQNRGRRHEGRRRRALQIRSGHVPPARQQGQRLSDRSRGAEGRQNLQRRCGFCHAGCLIAGKHGADLRSYQRKPGLDRQRHHHGPASADTRGQGAGRQRRCATGSRSGASQGSFLLGGAAAGRAV